MWRGICAAAKRAILPPHIVRRPDLIRISASPCAHFTTAHRCPPHSTIARGAVRLRPPHIGYWPEIVRRRLLEDAARRTVGSTKGCAESRVRGGHHGCPFGGRRGGSRGRRGRGRRSRGVVMGARCCSLPLPGDADAAVAPSPRTRVNEPSSGHLYVGDGRMPRNAWTGDLH